MDVFLNLKSEVNDHWMVSGDKNTSYFHNRASQKFRRNTITALRGQNGEMVSGEDEIAALAMGYYKSLFSSSTLDNFEDVVQHTQRVVSEEMNSDLIAKFSKIEVEIALNQMAPLKAPGPNGMPPIFFPTLLVQYS